MTIELDHIMVHARDQDAAAKRLAEILGVAWGRAAVGPFTAVYVNEGLTLDFISTDEAFPVEHFCFRVTPREFERILARLIAGRIPYRSTVRGANDMTVDPTYGNVYWDEPEGHRWEMLTVSYARPPARPAAGS
jgi:hypothetical protein